MHGRVLDDRLAEVGRRPFGEYHLMAGTTRKAVRGTDIVDLDAPDVVLWRAEHLVAYGAALRPGLGRPPVFVFQYIWPHLGFYRLVEIVRGLLAAAEGLADMAERDLAAALAFGDGAPNDDVVELHTALARLWIAERPAVARAHAQMAVRRSSDPERTRERLLRERALAGLLAGPT